MARRYAEGTQVPVEKTQAEISTLLTKMGVIQQMTAQTVDAITVAFVLRGVAYRLTVPKPDPTLPAFTRVKINACSWKPANAQQVGEKVALETARRLRALGALIKARMVAVQEGIITVEQAFIGDIVVGANGQTLADHALPQIAKAIEEGRQPCMLALPGISNG